MVVVSFLVMIYYNLVIAYSFHYLFSGFAKVLPWTRCDAWWNRKKSEKKHEPNVGLEPTTVGLRVQRSTD